MVQIDARGSGTSGRGTIVRQRSQIQTAPETKRVFCASVTDKQKLDGKMGARARGTARPPAPQHRRLKNLSLMYEKSVRLLCPPLSGVRHTYSWRTPDSFMWNLSAFLQPQSRFRDGRLIVETAVNPQIFREPRRTNDFLCSADKHCRRIPFRARYDIQHPMHTVGKIHIPTPRFAEHRRVTGRLSATRVRRLVAQTVIRFHFRNLQSHYFPSNHAAQKTTKEFLGNEKSWTFEKSLRQCLSHVPYFADFLKNCYSFPVFFLLKIGN